MAPYFETFYKFFGQKSFSPFVHAVWLTQFIYDDLFWSLFPLLGYYRPVSGVYIPEELGWGDIIFVMSCFVIFIFKHTKLGLQT